MCGIAALISDGMTAFDIEYVQQKLKNRGPDSFRIVENLSIPVTYLSSVLHIQGEICSVQPLEDSGNILCWNGEVFGGIILNDHESDSCQIFRILNQAIASQIEKNDIDIVVSELLSKVWGPYAFIYYSSHNNCLYYGRDPFGRRSLMQVTDVTGNVLSISSIPLINRLSYDWKEIITEGIFKIDFSSECYASTIIQWPHTRLKLSRQLNSRARDADFINESCTEFLEILKRSIKRRLNRLNKTYSKNSQVGVLFSGGIDSVLIAATLHLCLTNCNSAIDLINVTFYGTIDTHNLTQSPDRLASIAAFNELSSLFPERKWNLIHVDVSSRERLKYEETIKDLIYPANTHMDLNIGTAFWFASRGQGYLYDREDEGDTVYSATLNGRPLLRLGGKGFDLSVGLKESTRDKSIRINCAKDGCKYKSKYGCILMLCKICCFKHQLVHSNTCNVHKKNLRDSKIKSESLEGLEIPDEVDRLIDREFNGTNIEIPLTSIRNSELFVSELHSKQSYGDAYSLEHNENEEIIDSQAVSESMHEQFKSCCRVLLVGIGADEQMAGYGRHRTTYLKGGVDALEQELNIDMSRLWQRNLGRY